MEDPRCYRGKKYCCRVQIIVACAVLHNFCILAGDEWDKDDFNDDDDNGPNNNDDVLRDGDDIRDLFKNNL